MEAQGSADPKVDLIDTVQNRGIQHHKGEDNIRSVEATDEYVRKSIDYEQGVFNA